MVKMWAIHPSSSIPKSKTWIRWIKTRVIYLGKVLWHLALFWPSPGHLGDAILGFAGMSFAYDKRGICVSSERGIAFVARSSSFYIICMLPVWRVFRWPLYMCIVWYATFCWFGDLHIRGVRLWNCRLAPAQRSSDTGKRIPFNWKWRPAWYICWLSLLLDTLSCWLSFHVGEKKKKEEKPEKQQGGANLCTSSCN